VLFCVLEFFRKIHANLLLFVGP